MARMFRRFRTGVLSSACATWACAAQGCDSEPRSPDIAAERGALLERALDGELDDADRSAHEELRQRRRKPVEPRVDCVELDADGWLRAYWGYSNPNAKRVVRQLGPHNAFSPKPQDRDQPRRFEPGEHKRVFSVRFPNSAELTWRLDGRSASARNGSPRCPPGQAGAPGSGSGGSPAGGTGGAGGMAGGPGDTSETPGALAWAKFITSKHGVQVPRGSSVLGGYVAAAADGSIATTGSFLGAATFGAGAPNATTLLTAAVQDNDVTALDAYVAQYAVDGSFRWVRQIVGAPSGAIVAKAIAAGPDGSAYVTGWFEGHATFASGSSAQATRLAVRGSRDLFLAKYSSDGTLAWTVQAGGDSGVEANAVAALADGSVALVGGLWGTATFGLGEARQTSLSSTQPSSSDAFVAVFAADGTLTWVRQAGGLNPNGPSAVSAGSVAALSDSALLVTGTSGPEGIFNLGRPDQAVLVGGGLFVARYTVDGGLAWVRADGLGSAAGLAIAGAPDGSALVTGLYGWGSGPTTFGAGQANETVLASTDTYEGFVAQYAADGAFRWVRAVVGDGHQQSLAVAAQADGAALITGRFAGSTRFGQGADKITVLDSDGGDDVFVARYAHDGALLWAKRAGGNGGDSGLSIATLPDGSVLVGGSVNQNPSGGVQATFGAGEANETSTTAEGAMDAFIAKFYL